LIYMLQTTSIPARYVCGYICPNQDGLRGEGASHAWVEAYLPTYGWLGVDPTNNCVVGDKHVKIAIGRHFDDVAPVKGVYSGGAFQTMKATVTVSHK
jgi:transglutaminase-like putative cysteine protease